MALTTSLRVAINGKVTTTPDLGSNTANRAIDVALSLTSGTGAGQADLMFADTRQLAASGTEDLDLAGVLTDSFGATLTFARLKAIVIQAASGNTNNVVVSRPASNGLVLFSAASDALPLRPGALFVWAAGIADATGLAVTAGTGDLLTITNSAGSTTVDYSVVIVGCSA